MKKYRLWLMIMFLFNGSFITQIQAQSTVILPKVRSYAVDLSWIAPVNSSGLPACTAQLISAQTPCWDAVAGYNAYRSPTGVSTFSLLNATPTTLTAYTDTTVVSGNTYDYIVRSTDDSGNTSVPSNLITMPIPDIPSPPVIATLSAT